MRLIDIFCGTGSIDLEPLANAITITIEENMRDYKTNNNYATNNATRFAVQDIMNTNISRAADTLGFKKVLFKRAGWKLMCWYHPELNIAFSVMSEKKYNRIKKYGRSNHYVKIMVEVQNNEIEPYAEQLILFDDPELEAEHNNTRDTVFREISGVDYMNFVSCKHFIITYSYLGEFINKINCILPSRDFIQVDKLSLTELILPQLVTTDSDFGIISNGVKHIEPINRPVINLKESLKPRIHKNR